MLRAMRTWWSWIRSKPGAVSRLGYGHRKPGARNKRGGLARRGREVRTIRRTAGAWFRTQAGRQHPEKILSRLTAKERRLGRKLRFVWQLKSKKGRAQGDLTPL